MDPPLQKNECKSLHTFPEQHASNADSCLGEGRILDFKVALMTSVNINKTVYDKITHCTTTLSLCRNKTVTVFLNGQFKSLLSLTTPVICACQSQPKVLRTSFPVLGNVDA